MSHPDSPLPGPIFVPKYIHIDPSHAEHFEGIRASMVPAYCVAGERYRVDAAARESADLLLIDPQTNALTYRGFLDKTTYLQIPYAPAEEPIRAREMIRDDRRANEFVGEVLDFQREHGAGVLVAPYFYARDLDDGRYWANLRMLASARDQVRDDEVLYATVNVSGSILNSPRIIDELASDYEDLDPFGILLMFENVDDRDVSLETLVGLARLTQRLSGRRDLIVYPIAAYGQVLTALGANGFVSGVGWLEVFRESSLKPDRPAFGPTTHRARFYYVPELFSYVHPEQVEEIFFESETMRDYLCQCEVCAGGIPEPEASQEKKRHFLIRRHGEMADLAEADDPPEHMRDRLSLALQLAGAIEDEALVRIQTEHLLRWIEAIDYCTQGRGEGADTDLDEEELEEIIRRERGRGGDAPSGS